MSHIRPLTHLEPGQPILVGGNRVLHVSADLANRFAPGDRLLVVPETESVLHIPAHEQEQAATAVAQAHAAFTRMGTVSDEQICKFYQVFAARLEDEHIWQTILEANQADVAQAQRLGRSTTRLVATPKLRAGMIEGLRGWTDQVSQRGAVLSQVDHGDWSVDLVGDALGVIGFIFEGRPNVIADATGVLRGGNTVVFRIGSDALGTARTMLAQAVRPALVEAQLPEHAVALVDSTAHAAGWALFSDTRLSLAVARGSGPAVATLGGLAQQHGIPVSLHGTGGAWMVAAPDADPAVFEEAVFRSLDRKVCNTLNTCCIVASQARTLVPRLLAGLERAGERIGHGYKLHATPAARPHLPGELFSRSLMVQRADGPQEEVQAQDIAGDQLGREWEWEQTPEVTVTVVDSVDEAIALFNQQSPHFVATLISNDATQHQQFFERIDAPFVGDGFTRWVDGQYALKRPELGLTNWERGRLMGRSGILSGDTVFTVRLRARNT